MAPSDGSDRAVTPAEGSTGARFAGQALSVRRGERLVLSDLSFALVDGAALLLAGPNGAGKSTLLRTMAGLLPPASGCMIWNGAAIADDPDAHRMRVAYVGHRDAVKPGLGVAENLAGWAALLPTSALPPSERHARIASSLAAFGLDALADLPARYLSAGQRRRLALARLLLAPKPLWLLDEPHAALDAESTGALEKIIAAHRARGGIVVVASHGGLDLPDARRLDLNRTALAA